jgi:hypothetical protein
LVDGTALHSKLTQIGSEEMHFPTLSEKFWISERNLCAWLPRRMETIKPAK